MSNAPDSNAAQVVELNTLWRFSHLIPDREPGGSLNDLNIDIAALKRELNCYVTLKPRRRHRHGGKFRGYEACSFCGRPGSEAGQLVAGPGCGFAHPP